MVRKSDRYDMTLIVLTGPFNSKLTNNLKTNYLDSTHMYRHPFLYRHSIQRQNSLYDNLIVMKPSLKR